MSGIIVACTHIAKAVSQVLRLGLRELGVLAGDKDALGLRIVDQRIERFVAGVPHDGDAIRLGGRRLTELLDHLLRIPA
jgi:hypothetical protein